MRLPSTCCVIVQNAGGLSVQMDDSDQRWERLGIVVDIEAFRQWHDNLDLADFQGDGSAGARQDDPVEEVDSPEGVRSF